MTETPAVGARISVVRLLLLAVAVAGLFAMHGLGDHGTAHSGHGSAHLVSEHPPAAAATHDSSQVGTVPSAPAEAGSGVTSLCMAVLAGVLFALAGLRAWGRLPAMLALRPRPGTRLAATARERDPPRLVQLSVLRC